MESLQKTFNYLEGSYFTHSNVAASFGLYSAQVVVPNPAGKPSIYLVFSVKPIDDGVNPVEIINKVERNNHLFYPEAFAIDINTNNPLVVWDKITDYLCYAEFLVFLYEDFGAQLPQYIRYNEIYDLMDFYFNKKNPDFTIESRKQYATALCEFFKNEKTDSKFKKEWQEFYRSELYNDEQSFVKNMVKFLKRDEPETEIDVLFESNDNLKKIRVPEHYYKKFKEIIVEKYPDVKYHVGEKRIVDKGLIVDPKTKERVVTQYGKTVSAEEYDEIFERDFAEKGYEAVDGLNKSYFENRDIVYKASDENIVASILNDIMYKWAKCPSLETLQQNGKINLIDIPIGYLKNFYLFMQDNNIPFCIDNDVNRKPNFEVVHVLYNAKDKEKVNNLVAGLAIASISMRHVTLKDATYNIDLKEIDSIIKDAKKRIETSEKTISDNNSIEIDM